MKSITFTRKDKGSTAAQNETTFTKYAYVDDIKELRSAKITFFKRSYTLSEDGKKHVILHEILHGTVSNKKSVQPELDATARSFRLLKKWKLVAENYVSQQYGY